jgi:hypothetical protein
MTIEANSLTPMKLTVRAINVLGFVFYLAYIGIIAGMFGMPNKLFPSTLLMLTPFPYFLICIATSFAHWRSGGVLLAGIFAHMIVMAASVAALTEESYWPALLFILYATAWFTMYFKLSPA